MSLSLENATQLFSAFISTKKILIADPNRAASVGLAKIIINLGAKTNHIILVSDYKEALERFQKDRPDVIISEFILKGGTGLDLAHETILPHEQKQRIFIMITSNSSQSVVAQAAEEDVDLFIIKPYTIKSFSEKLINTILAKIYPSDYIKAIEQGKKLLKENQPEQAIHVFDHAITLNSKPSLALFYRAQAELYKHLVDRAEGSYVKGLDFNEIHYKCITGLFDLLLKQNRTKDAYGVVRKIASVFPANPKRLMQLLDLAVQTGSYEDIANYYEYFVNIEDRDEVLVKYVCAALVVCGRHFLQNGKSDLAVDLLRKASISAAGRAHVLREIVLTLADGDCILEAKEVLLRFTPESKQGNDFKVAKFVVYSAEGQDPKKALAELSALMKQGVEDAVLHFYKIKNLVQLKKMKDAIEALQVANSKWPALESYFQRALKAGEE